MAQAPYGMKPGAGYSQVPRGGSPSHTEAWALVEAARRMAESVAVYEQDGSQDNKKAVRDNLRLNWRLWTIFQAEMTAEDSPIPQELRINMLTLCKFVDSETVALLADLDVAKVVNLVEINRHIATGLLEGLNKSADASAAPAKQSLESAAPAMKPKPIDKTA